MASRGTRGAPGVSTMRAPWSCPVLLFAFAALAACEPPDRPPTLPGDFPDAAVRFLQPDRMSTFRLEEGVVYRAVRSGTHPWSVHLLEVDTSRCELGFQVAKAEGEGRLPVSEMARRTEPGVLAAVNGDFFTPEDRPLGVEVAGGELRGRAARPVFAWRPGDGPWLGTVELTGDSLRVGPWALSVDDPDPGTQVISGFPALLMDGRRVGDLELEERPAFAAQRHPRTAVGWNPGTGRLWLVVVDGRREGVSEGMTLPELADLFRALGVRNAVNLDGGGSSVMIVRGQTVNRPSDPAGERSVVNALLVRQDFAYCSSGRPGSPPPTPRPGPRPGAGTEALSPS